MVDYRPLLFLNALALMLLVTAGFASVQRDAGHLPDRPPTTAMASHTAPSPTAKNATTTQQAVTNRKPPESDESPVFADTRNASDDAKNGTQGEAKAATVATKKTATEPALLAEPFVINQTADASENAAPPAPSAGQQLAVAEPQMPAVETKAPPAPTPKVGQLTLRSNVLGDRVQINGRAYGSTRLDLELDPGAYDVVISKDGYKPWNQTVHIDAGDDLTLVGKLEQYTRVNYRNGEWQGGIRTGDGTYEDDTGLVYTGHFIDGKFDGKGVARYPNGSRYDGDWSAGVRTGEGTFRAADGSVYDGQFANDEFNGEGTLTRANGDVLTGQWSEGRLNGHGSLTTADGMLYVGGFKGGQFHGDGTLTYPDGHHYEGGFSNGEFHGEGSEIFADGKKYVGHYIEGEFHGEGTLMNPNGSSIAGTFRYGEPYGQAKLTTPEGEVFNARTTEPGVCYRDKSYRATQCPPLEGW